MKIFISISLMAIMLIPFTLIAQDFNGIATYKTQRKLDIQLDSTQINGEMQSQMMAMLKKQFEKEYTLNFTKDESIYKVVEKLEDPGSGGASGIQIVVAGMGTSDILYKNVKEGYFATQTDLFGKIFLVKDKIAPSEWVMGKETKNIGEYTCFKATYQRKVTIESAFSSQRGARNDSISDTAEERDQTIIAWYTLQIPVKHGPGQYGGLPGLVLEATDGSETILCSKIVLNPKEGVKIVEPTKGKEVTQEKYDTIMEKKMKEMNDQRDGRRGDGNSFEIRIGG